MGQRLGSGHGQANGGTTAGNGTEFLVVATNLFSPPFDNPVVYVFGQFTVTIGTSGTLAKVRLRRGTAGTGTIIGSSGAPGNVTVAAASLYSFSICAFDQPGAIGLSGYSLTLQVTNEAAASTIGDATIIAFAL